MTSSNLRLVKVERDDQPRQRQQQPARTLLEQLIRCSRRTIEENCAAFEKTARTNGEDATLSSRTIQRWMAGEVATARPVMQRVAELHWGHNFETLVGPPSSAEPAPTRRHEALAAVDAAPLSIHPVKSTSTTVQLVITPGTAVVVVPADHPVLLAFVASQ